MSKREQAENYFRQGYNCAQAVAVAYHAELGLEESVVAKMVSSFGGGFGRLREVCGAVSGAVFVLGALRGYSDPTATTEKADHYKAVQDFASAFRERNQSIICRDLLDDTAECSHVPEKRTEEYYKKRPCVALVGDAAEILEDMLNN